MSMQFVYYYKSPLGVLEIKSSDTDITHVLFTEKENIPAAVIPPVITLCTQQLDEYFEGKRKFFELPLKPNGTFFQLSVWNELQRIQYAQTISYNELAIKIGNKESIRAVGSANGRNPVVIIIPCHRVIGSDGSLTGYGGGLYRKQWLLEHEAKYGKGILQLFEHANSM